MRSIKYNYNQSKLSDPYLSNYIHLAIAVKGRKFTRKQILENFSELVPKAAYDEVDKYYLISNLYSLSKVLVDLQTDSENRPGASTNHNNDTDIKETPSREEMKECLWEDYVAISNKYRLASTK